jgi:alpha-ketoglutarate-dependent taurine dioxygenase
MDITVDPIEMQAVTSPSTITTTLYDLIAAMQSVVKPEEDELVVTAMIHLLRSGRIRFMRPSGKADATAHTTLIREGMEPWPS